MNIETLPIDISRKNVKTNIPCQNVQLGMVLTEYENENIMNGGKLFLDLQAYNKESDYFANIGEQLHYTRTMFVYMNHKN